MGSSRVLVLTDTRPQEELIDERIAAAQAGDRDAFTALYDAHAGRVYALCMRLLADPDRAGEMLQDVFLHVWERLHTFRGESSFTTWLHRVTVNKVLMQKRSDRRRTARVSLLDDDSAPAVEPRAAPTEPGLGIDIERAVANLPAKPRMVFVLHDVEGYQHDEIARLMGIPLGTVRSHLFRARRQLREELS